MEAVMPAAAEAPAASPPSAKPDMRRMEAVIPAALRADVIIRRQFFKHQEYYVIKDPLALTYFRLLPEEAYILTQLDGKRTLRQIAQRFTQRYPNHSRSVVELAQFVNQLGASGLLSLSASRFMENARRTVPQQLLTSWAKMVGGLLFLKIPLIDPSAWLGDLVHALRFLWTKWFVGAALLLFVWTAGLLLANAGEFSSQHLDFFSASNLLLLWFTIIFIKTLHEFGHAMTCRRFGGEVHEMGVCLMLFTPCGYVDASDAWMMRHKRHKLFVTLAGVFTELILACIAAHLWLVLPDGIARTLAFNAMLVASVNTLIFNINPLMRFDGYYVMCDLLEVPNLRSKAMSFCSYHLQRLLLGYRNRQQESMFEQEANGRVFVIYSVAAYVYMIFIIYGITQIFGRILAPVGLREFGLYLGYFVEASFIALPFIKVFMDATKPGAHIVKTGSAGRRLSAIALGLAVIVGVSFVMPSHHHVTQQAVVAPESFEGVASEVGGVISRIHVRTGQWVEAGELLVTLSNSEVEAELLVAEAARQQARVQFGSSAYAQHWSLARGRAGVAQQMEVAEAGYQLAAARAAKLQIRATTAGYVLTPNVEKLTGAYAGPFELIMRLGDTRRLKLVVPLTEDEAQLVERGSKVSGRWLATADSFESHLDAISSQPARPADLQLGMIAHFGGSVPPHLLQRRPHEPVDYPVFLASAPLEQPAHTMVDGLRVRVTIEGKETTVGRKAWRWFMSLFDLKADVGTQKRR
jgi:putative peptide zinc metalloprotease protein